jgi:hypothetical protein
MERRSQFRWRGELPLRAAGGGRQILILIPTTDCKSRGNPGAFLYPNAIRLFTDLDKDSQRRIDDPGRTRSSRAPM